VAGEVVNNAANIVLNGPTANTLLIDAGGNNALKPLAANTTANSSLTIEGGYSFTTVGAFSNAGTVKVLASSALTVGPGGVSFYTQSGGLTKVNGTLTAQSGVTINGGTLDGVGTVNGSVQNIGGTVMPGDPPGILTIHGSYNQDTGGALDILLGGTTGGTGYSQLKVDDTSSLAGALDLNLVNGFNLATGQTFDILGTGEGLTNGMTSLSLDGQTCAADGTDMYRCQVGSFFDIFTEITLDPGTLVSGTNPMDLVLNVTVTGVGGVPEPSTWAMMAIGFAGSGLPAIARRSESASPPLESKGANHDTKGRRNRRLFGLARRPRIRVSRRTHQSAEMAGDLEPVRAIVEIAGVEVVGGRTLEAAEADCLQILRQALRPEETLERFALPVDSGAERVERRRLGVGQRVAGERVVERDGALRAEGADLREGRHHRLRRQILRDAQPRKEGRLVAPEPAPFQAGWQLPTFEIERNERD